MKFNGVRQISVLKICTPSIPVVCIVHGTMAGKNVQLRMEGGKEGEGETPNINPKILKCSCAFCTKTW